MKSRFRDFFKAASRPLLIIVVIFPTSKIPRSDTFFPHLPKVFSLDRPEAIQTVYNPSRARARPAELERMAEQIATLCSTLGEYPSIRYRA